MLGSLSKLGVTLAVALFLVTKTLCFLHSDTPLDACQYGGHIVRWAPAILQDVKAQLARGVDVGVEHLANELDGWRLVWILLFKVHYEAEGSVLKGRVCWADNDSIPVSARGISSNQPGALLRSVTMIIPSEYSLPCHDIVGYRRC